MEKLLEKHKKEIAEHNEKWKNASVEAMNRNSAELERKLEEIDDLMESQRNIAEETSNNKIEQRIAKKMAMLKKKAIDRLQAKYEREVDRIDIKYGKKLESLKKKHERQISNAKKPLATKSVPKKPVEKKPKKVKEVKKESKEMNVSELTKGLNEQKFLELTMSYRNSNKKLFNLLSKAFEARFGYEI